MRVPVTRYRIRAVQRVQNVTACSTSSEPCEKATLINMSLSQRDTMRKA